MVLGFVGAALGISYMPPMRKRDVFAALFSGLIMAGLAPQWAGHYYEKFFTEPIPAFMNNTIAFFFGIGGMFIVPGAIAAWTAIRANPFVIVDWIGRLKARAPTAPPPGADETPPAAGGSK